MSRVRLEAGIQLTDGVWKGAQSKNCSISMVMFNNRDTKKEFVPTVSVPGSVG